MDAYRVRVGLHDQLRVPYPFVPQAAYARASANPADPGRRYLRQRQFL
jgi:hypothetical protein